MIFFKERFKNKFDFLRRVTLMRKQIEKIITMTVAAGLMTSTLFGEAGYAAKVKKPYYKTGVKTDYLVNDAALFKKTGVVLSFREKYAETSGYNPVSYSVYGLGADKERPLTGYVMIGNVNKFGKCISYEVLDNTGSVDKIVLDGKKSYKLDKVRKPAENDSVSWEDFGKKTAAELNMEFKTASKLKIPEGKHTLSITDKHGHKSILKVWKDTKAPKIKVTRKGKKITCKITDKSGIDEVNGKKISKNGKIIKSYTVKGDCVVSDLAGNESVSYSFK
mgnify:FL=1